MLIIGCDFHTRYQQIAMMDETTGELVERRLDDQSGEAHAFNRSLPEPVRWRPIPTPATWLGPPRRLRPRMACGFFFSSFPISHPANPPAAFPISLCDESKARRVRPRMRISF